MNTRKDASLNNIYLIICQPHTKVSRVLSFFTKDNYNHVAVSLNTDLTHMYSFARRHEHFPLPGGFEEESIDKKTYGKHPDTKIIVLSVTITAEQKERISNRIHNMYENKKYYRYNLVGLVLAYFNISVHRQNAFFCSEFVRDLLIDSKIVSEDSVPKVCKPYDFINLTQKTHCNKIFDGTICQWKNKYA